MRAGAYEALAELARNDIRAVADPAATAVCEAAVHPEEAELHFGRVEQGSAPPHRIVRLLGPPIARACAPRASDDWIRLTETAGEFDISVSTDDAGIRRGTLDLKGPTGEAVIAIDVEVLSAEQAAEEKARQEAQQAAEEKARQEAQQAAERAAKEAQQAAPADREQVSSAGRSRSPQAVPPAAPAAVPPSIRTGMAFAGVALAILAGVAGIIPTISYAPGTPGVFTFFDLAVDVIAIAVAVAVLLLPKHRLVAIGLLQGMWWPTAAGVVYIIAIALATHLSGYTGRPLAAFVLNALSYVLGTIAAVVLIVSWRPAADRRRTPTPGALPVLLLCSIGLSLIADAIFDATTRIPRAAGYALGATWIVVGLAVTWYAVTLRARMLGGALALGWVITAAMLLMPVVFTLGEFTGISRVAAVLALALLATAAIFAIIYMRQPTYPESQPPHAATSVADGTAH